MTPSIACAIIARNEARDLPKCIASLKDVVSYVVVVDTGSTDETLLVARKAAEEIGAKFYGERYLDASELNPDRPGEWRITNFAAARNRALARAEDTGCSSVFWMDADDLVETPLAIRRAAYLPDAVYSMWVELGGGTRQAVPRLWPASYKIRYYGWVHEWPEISKFPSAVLNDCCIRHDATPHESAGEDSNQRNLRILTAQYEVEPDARTAFYLANTHKDAGRWNEAVDWYRKRLEYGSAWRDEYLFAMLYLIRCLRSDGRLSEAEFECERALKEAPDWQEFRMELAFMLYKEKNYERAIAEATKALDKPVPPTVLWRERAMYRDQPARIISWSHEHLGNLTQALVWSQLATRLIGHYDEDWAKREAILSERIDAPPLPPYIHKGLRRKIALHRPGAIGDILMTLNLIPAFKEANPETDVHYFCAAQYGKPDALGSIMTQAGVDMVMDAASLPQWRKQYDRVIDLIGYPLAEGYPDKPMRNHLLDYFSVELGLAAFDGLPALTLRRPKRLHPPMAPGYIPYATIQKSAGWSKYKQWPNERWEQVIDRLSHLDFLLIDASVGLTLADSIAVFANAEMHIGIDSFCNHLTNYYWTDEHGGRRVPGVILWGSTQASAAGYPHNKNISLGLPCQPCFREAPSISRMPRGPCINPPRATYDDDTPHACMDGISLEQVVDAVLEMWESTTPQ